MVKIGSGIYVAYDKDNADHAFVTEFAPNLILIGVEQTDASYTDYSQFSASLKVTASVKYATSFVEEEFAVTIRDACLDVQSGDITDMVCTQGCSNSLINYNLHDEVTLNFSPISISTVQGCPVKYWLTSNLYAETADTIKFDLEMTIANGGIITGVIDGADGDTMDWKIVATLGNMLQPNSDLDTDRVSEISWNFDVTDTCAQVGTLVTRITDDHLFEGEHWVGDDLGSFRFYNYESQGCGGVSYELVDENKATLTDARIELVAADQADTFKNWQINYGTSDPTEYSNAPVTYYVKVSLDDYATDYPDTIIYEKFTVDYKNCMVTDFDFENISDLEYNIYTTGNSFNIPLFTEEIQAGYNRLPIPTCGYDITYTVLLDDGSALPAFMKWDEIDRIFSYSSDSIDDVNTYNIVVSASVSANMMSGGFSKDLTFTVKVENGCASDTIAFNDFIVDYTYYLGVDTDEDSGWPY
jgi:hypothetical protein